jgi:hypothetical protein
MDFLQLFQGIHELMEQSMEPPRHIRPEDEASNTYYVVYLAQRASEPGKSLNRDRLQRTAWLQSRNRVHQLAARAHELVVATQASD